MSIERLIVEAIESQQGQLTELLGTLVRFTTENPPGRNEKPAQYWVADRLRRLDAELDIFDVLPDRPNVIGLIRGLGGGHSVILNGHIDVVEARNRESWRHDPFEPVVENGVMYGRGTSDMKSALAAYLFVLDKLHDHGVRLRGDVIFQSVIGEETSEPGTRTAAEKYRADFAIVGEGTRSRQIVASVGSLTARITIKSPYTLHLHARRLALHAGGGMEGANAIDKMALHILPALNDLEREWAVFKRHPLIPPAQTLINAFRIQGGSTAGNMPDECTMYIIVLYLPGEKVEKVQKEVEDQINRAAELDGWLRKYPPKIVWNPPEHHMEFPSSDIDANLPGAKTLAKAIKDVTNCEAEFGGRGAITDAGWFQINGIPSVVFGPGDVYWAHRMDERVSLDDLVLYAKVMAIFLLRWCGIARSRNF